MEAGSSRTFADVRACKGLARAARSSERQLAILRGQLLVGGASSSTGDPSGKLTLEPQSDLSDRRSEQA